MVLMKSLVICTAYFWCLLFKADLGKLARLKKEKVVYIYILLDHPVFMLWYLINTPGASYNPEKKKKVFEIQLFNLVREDVTKSNI